MGEVDVKCWGHFDLFSILTAGMGGTVVILFGGHDISFLILSFYSLSF